MHQCRQAATLVLGEPPVESVWLPLFMQGTLSYLMCALTGSYLEQGCGTLSHVRTVICVAYPLQLCSLLGTQFQGKLLHLTILPLLDSVVNVHQCPGIISSFPRQYGCG